MTAETTRPSARADGGHPDWCVRPYCTANLWRSGAHRSTPIIVNDAPLLITANLYATAALPQDVMVEMRAASVLLPARIAYNLGQVLRSLGKAGDPR